MNANDAERTRQCPMAVDMIDAMEALSGIHPGYRRVHAKGACYRAVFHPSGEAAPYTTAPHLQGGAVDAIVRFSGNSSDPALADLLSPAKGMAVQFQLPGGVKTSLVGVTFPIFFAQTPESLLDLVRAVNEAQAGQLSVLDMFKEAAEHFSESKRSLLEIKRLLPPASYATNRYFTIHVFYLVDADGRRRPVKFEWMPDAGVDTLSLMEAAKRPADYLEQEMTERLQRGPASFTLQIVLGEPDDPTDDSTRPWPEERERLDAGRLVIEAAIQEPSGLLMDPTAVVDGVELSDDPILHFRHLAYAESFHRRSDSR
ncbi:catalase family peroxidase [Paenibacillus sp. 598K]|uniref:catalase family peroxidase n=1 Tax=Paenibacillus sp. 598K TaxID=1117987 RepID=UPI000FFEA710|nr:catalase family peroxidase [Paenibacillus sp. 598K]